MGFSAALNRETTSAYKDMSLYGITENTDHSIVKSFIAGYRKSRKTVREMGGRITWVSYRFADPSHAELFKI